MKNKIHQLLLAVIILVSAILRLRGFGQHYTLSSDSARDVLVAIGALLTGHLPWVGSFSSAGPFVFGPNWYWWLMFWKLIAPNFFLTPWLAMLLVSLIYVVIMYLVGRVAIGRRFGLILALIAATSPQTVALSAYLTQHALVEIFSGLALLGLVAYLRYHRYIFAFLMAFAIGMALSLHYQVINFLVYFPVVFLLERPRFRQWISLGIVLFLGFIIPLLPLLLWDASRGFANIIQLVYYFRVGQYRFWVSNRWLTYLGVFWPEYLGKFLGDKVIALALVLLGGPIGIWQLWKRAIPKTIIWPIIILVVQIVMLRYFRGEKYDGYLVYFHSVIILAVGWVLWELTRISKWSGAAMIMAVVFTSIRLTMPSTSWNNDGDKLMTMVKTLASRYPDEKFTVYVRSLSSSNCAYSFSAILEGANLGKSTGQPIGICQNGPDDCGQAKAIKLSRINFQGSSCTLVDLQNVDANTLTKKNDWYNFEASAVYDDVQNWWRKSL